MRTKLIFGLLFWCAALGAHAQVVIVSQCPQGVDVFATFNNCAAELPTGGTIDARSLGAATYTVTTPLTALSTASRPITLMLDGPATKFLINTVFSSASIAAGTACAVPVGQGSTVWAPGFNSTFVGNFLAGPLLQTYDIVCNADKSGSQESFNLTGVGVVGNYQATVKGSLIHLRDVFVPTLVENSSTYLCYAACLTVEGGSDNLFLNSMFSDGSSFGPHPNQPYSGAVVTLTGTDHVTFIGGAIQDPGPHSPLMVVQAFSATFGIPGENNISSHFTGVDFELSPATIGTFPGHAADVTPFQLEDATDLVINNMTVFGNGGGDIHVLAEILSSGFNGQIRGPVELNNIAVYDTFHFAGLPLVTNSNPSVAPSLTSVVGVVDGPSLAIGKYRWTGSGGAGSSATDMLDSQNVASETDHSLNIVPVPFASLPASIEGQIATITDGNSNVWGAIVGGGGSYHESVYFDGTHWLVQAVQSTPASLPIVRSMTICASGCSQTAAICTTSAIAGYSGACNVGTFPWPAAFADINYSVTCQAIYPATAFGGAVFASVPIGQKSTTGITVYLWNLTAAAETAPEIDCQAVHN